MLSSRVVVFAAAALICCGAGKSGVQSFTVQASGAESRDDQVVSLQSVRMGGNVPGVRVYVNPPEGGDLSPDSPSYAGSVFPSHREAGGEASGDFIVRLRHKVSGEARVVVEPMGSAESANVSVGKVEIVPASKVRGAIEGGKR